MLATGFHPSRSSGTTPWVRSLSQWLGLSGSSLDPGHLSQRVTLTPVTGWDGNPPLWTVTRQDLGPAQLPQALSHAALPGPTSCHGWPHAGPGGVGPHAGSKAHGCAHTAPHTSDTRGHSLQPPWGWGALGSCWGGSTRRHGRLRCGTCSQACTHVDGAHRPLHSCSEPASGWETWRLDEALGSRGFCRGLRRAVGAPAEGWP